MTLRGWQEKGLVFMGMMSCKDKTVLDVGCGTGWMSNLLLEKGAQQVVAMDLSAIRPVALLEHIPYVQTLEELKQPLPSIFDILWCHHMLEHLENPIAFLTELAKIGKQLWIALPFACSPYAFAKGHIHNYNMPLLAEHLRRSGWDASNGSYYTDMNPSGTRQLLWAVIDVGGDGTYPEPMDELNVEGVNTAHNLVFDTWNWEKISG